MISDEVKKRPVRGASAFLVVALWSLGQTAWAEPSRVGDGPGGLPAIHGVGVVDDEQHRLTLVGAMGYGLTESMLGGDDQHHRLTWRLSGTYRPLRWLAVGYTQDLRYDRHSGVPSGSDDGWIIEPRFRLRGGWVFARGFRVGGEAVVWLPASDSGARVGQGASADLVALGAYQPLPSLLLAARVGYRLDRSAVGASQADQLSAADRLSLGVSDCHAVLMGVGLSWRWRWLEFLGEWTWDLLVGEHAPPAAESPMLVTAGVRYWPWESLQVGLLATVSPSARPSLAGEAPLVPVEPLFTVTAAVAYRLGLTKTRWWGRRDLSGTVLTAADLPLAGAVVTVIQGDDVRETLSDSQGGFELRLPRRGAYELKVNAPTWLEHREHATVGSQRPPQLRIRLLPAPGSLHGVVLTPEGTPMTGARVQLTTGGQTVERETDAQGEFVFEGVALGGIQVFAGAEGFQEQTVEAEIERGQTTELQISLARALPDGQLRGDVRSPAGQPLAATVIVESGRSRGVRHLTGADGTFELNLQPGTYRVRVVAQGMAEERLRVEIQQNGVVVLNIVLRHGRGGRGRR